MASTHIQVLSTASRLSADVRAFVDTLTRVVGASGDIKAIMDTVASGGDWDALGTKLGTSAADAEAVYNLMAAVDTELSATNIGQLTSRVG